MTTYEESGVSVEKNDRLVDMIRDIADISTGFSDAQPIPGTDLFLVQCSDGVGTKIHYATQHYDLLKTIGQDLVAMCVNDLICAGAKPLWFQDYIGMNSLNTEMVNIVVKSINDACKQCGVKLTGGEMAEMPGTYVKHIPELVGFASGIATKETLIDSSNVRPGSKIIGLPSSGVHSNGFSLIRKAFPTLPNDMHFKLQLLAPTELYCKVSDIHQTYPNRIQSMAHITGGGLENNLARAIPKGVKAEINYNRWQIPEIFQHIHNYGNVDPDDMWKTFNMGVGMCLIVSDYYVDKVMSSLYRHHGAFVLGEIVPA